jgi:hypothetical protein
MPSPQGAAPAQLLEKKLEDDQRSFEGQEEPTLISDLRLKCSVSNPFLFYLNINHLQYVSKMYSMLVTFVRHSGTCYAQIEQL